MKEIGEVLKQTREKNGVTAEEAAEDLNLKVSQINSIESGDLKAFKDVCYLKFFIRDYAKYLGLDADKTLDDFNEFIFDYTSRIPVDDICKVKNDKNKDDKKVASPYTTHKGLHFELSPLVTYILIGILVIAIIYLTVGIFLKNDIKILGLNMNTGVDQYEFSQ